MTVEEAAAVLGVAATASPAEVRAAFRREVRRHHPDRTGASRASERTAQIIGAYETLRRSASTFDHGVTGRATPPPAAPRAAAEPGTFLVALAGVPDRFFSLLEAGHQLGDVTYASRSDGIVEALVVDDDGRTCSLLMRLDESGDSVTMSADPLDAGGRPDTARYARRLAALLASAR
jgi:hypothetical protein